MTKTYIKARPGTDQGYTLSPDGLYRKLCHFPMCSEVLVRDHKGRLLRIEKLNGAVK